MDISAWDNRDKSVWLETAIPAPDARQLDGDVDVEVAVVGAGYTGCSAALHLAATGKSVALLDAGQPGWGASGRSAGWVCPNWWFHTPPSQIVKWFGEERGQRLNRLAPEAGRYIYELTQRYQIACDYRTTGHVYASLTDRMRDTLETEAEEWAAYDHPIEILDAAQLAEVIPTDRYRHGMRVVNSGLINPLSYVRGLARAAQSCGVHVYSNSPVRSLQQQRDRWKLLTPKGSVLASRVLLATNAYEQGLWPGLQNSFIRWTLAFVATDPLPDKGAALLPKDGGFIDVDYSNIFSLRVDTEGRLGTSTAALAFPSFEPEKVAAQFTNKFKRIFPTVALPAWRYVHFGQIAMNTDILPHLYSLAPGLYAANSYCGNGIVLGTQMGRQVANMFVADDPEECAFPLRALKPVRSKRVMEGVSRFVLQPLARLRSRFL